MTKNGLSMLIWFFIFGKISHSRGFYDSNSEELFPEGQGQVISLPSQAKQQQLHQHLQPKLSGKKKKHLQLKQPSIAQVQDGCGGRVEVSSSQRRISPSVPSSIYKLRRFLVLSIEFLSICSSAFESICSTKASLCVNYPRNNRGVILLHKISISDQTAHIIQWETH